MSSEIKEQGQGFVDNIKSRFNKEIDLISKKTGYDGKLISGILFVCFILAFINFFGKYITCLVGVILPAYWSIKAIESPEFNDDKQWLTYWAIYGLFTLLDQFANIILRIIPFYFVIKIAFLIWCFMPNTMGALFVYNKLVGPYFRKYESKIDQRIEKFIKEGKLRGRKNRKNLRKEALELMEKQGENIEEFTKSLGDTVNNIVDEIKK